MNRAAPIGAEFYQWLFQNARDIVLVLDREGRILDANQAASVAYGYSHDELLTLSVFDLRQRDDRDTVSGQLNLAAVDGAIFEATHVRKDGTVFAVEVSARMAPLDGETYFVSLIRDVTERKRLEQELKEQYERLKELDELKTGFVNTVSHELRTPLASVVGFAEFLEEGVGGELGAEQLAYVEGIMQAGARLRLLVDDLLDFAKLSAGRARLARRDTDLAPVIRQAVDELRPQSQAKRLMLRAELPDAPITAPMDGERIGQVLRNLLSNAVKFTPEGGHITVRAGAQDGMVRVEVEDTGIGIPKDEQPRLFEQFYQVDSSLTREAGGTGLGLAIAKGLVEAHGGHLGLESAPGEGSTFWFELPTSAAGESS